jgi:hypothetical protein
LIIRVAAYQDTRAMGNMAMGNMEGWDIALLAAAGYMAVTALVRMMIRQRDRLVDELSREAAKQRARIKTQQHIEEARQRQEEAERRMRA